MAADWKVASSGSSSGLTIDSVGDGLATALGVLTAKVTSGIEFDGSGNIVVKNGSGIAIDGTGHVTVNQGVGLGIDGSGFLVVKTTGAISLDGGGNVYVPGGAITNSLLAALSVATAQIQAGAVTTAKIGAAQITTALIANAAITNALIGSAAIGTANIQNAAITSALIANLAVGNAHINDLAANKITAGTISAAISITSPTITSTSGANSVTLSGGQLTVSSASSQVLLSSGSIRISPIGTGDSNFLANNSIGILNSSGFAVISMDTAGGFKTWNGAGTTTSHIDLTGTATFSGLVYSGGSELAKRSDVVLNYGAGVKISAALSGTTGGLGSYVNSVYCYDAAGAYIGQIPLI